MTGRHRVPEPDMRCCDYCPACGCCLCDPCGGDFDCQQGARPCQCPIDAEPAPAPSPVTVVHLPGGRS